MGTTSTVHKFLETEVKPAEAKIKKEYEAQLPRLKGMGQKLGEALATKDTTVAAARIRLYLKTGEPEFVLTRELLSRASKLLESIEKLPRAQTPEEFKEIDAATISVSQLKGRIEVTLNDLNQGKDKVLDAMNRPVEDGSAFTEEWAVVQTSIASHLTNAKWRLGQTNQLVTKANAALADRNWDEVVLLLEHSQKHREGNPAHADVAKQFKQFSAKVKASGLSKGAKDQLEREMPEMKQSLDQAATIEKSIVDNGDKIKALKLEPIDHKKAATALKIPGQYVPQLKLALEIKDRKKLERALDSLIAKMIADGNAWKIRGKDMIATLKKENLF